MKLRNKRTGGLANIMGEQNFFRVYTDAGWADYNSLTELNEEWEDYKPAEPLIKDDKIRKAVRAWAEANGIDGCVCKEEIHCITFETERGMFISFENTDPIPPEGNYTIAELCGRRNEGSNVL